MVAVTNCNGAHVEIIPGTQACIAILTAVANLSSHKVDIATGVNNQESFVTIDIESGSLVYEQANLTVDEAHKHKGHSGGLSSLTITTRDTVNETSAVGTTFSGDTTSILAGQNITVKGSNVVATNDVNLAAQGNVTITAATETSQEDHFRQEKKSGLFSGGGLGFTIGTQKQTSTDSLDSVSQKGSVIGSTDGNVNIEAGKDVLIKASDIVSKKDTDITGQNVTIEAAANTISERQTYEFKQTGLSVSIGGSTINAINNVYQPLERATEVEDGRLSTLYTIKAGMEAEKAITKNADISKDPTKSTGDKIFGENTFEVGISLGSSKSESKTDSKTVFAQGSSVTATGDVTIKATNGDLTINGSDIQGKNISLEAKENLNVLASENSNITNTDNKSSSASIGVSINLGTGAIGGTISASKSKGEIKENGTTHTESTITAKENLSIKTGQDVNFIGSQVKGDTVVAEVGGNLNIQSLQDKESYHEKQTGSSFGVSGIGLGKPDVTGGVNKQKTDSEYASVTEQAGIFAGKGGFDIEVGGNTDLKGAVIASDATPDKNKISTDTLSFSDIENKAEYEAGSNGIGYSSDKGFTPNPGMPVSGDASSTTKSAISPGTIIVGGKEVNPEALSRDPSGALNALGKIFDKKTVQEKQELANLFGEVAYKLVGDLAESQREKASTPEEKAKWAEGGEYKVALHALIGGIMSDLGGSGFASGAVGAGVSQAVQGELSKINDSNLRLIASALVGATASKLIGGDAQAGASTAYTGTKYNDYGHKPTYNGAIIYVKGVGFYEVTYDENGKEVDRYMDNPPPKGVYYWYQNPYDQSNGWDSVRGSGSAEDDEYYAGKVQYQYVAGSLFGHGIGVQITDDTDAQKQQKISAKLQEYANGMILLGSGYSGGSLAGGVTSVVKDTLATGKVIELKYITTSGVKLETTPARTTTVLGTYAEDTRSILDELGSVKSTDFGPRDGGFNLLNVPDNLYQNAEQFWNAYNKPWLDNAVARNDIIVLATRVTEATLYRTNPETGLKELTGFGKEFMYLTKECGYTFDPATMRMIPPTK